MKRCQKCNRTFPDENQKFCTFDGGLLLADQPTFDPNRTILAPQMGSLPPVPPPAPAPAPPAKPSTPERDLSETIVAYRPATIPEKTNVARPTTVVTGGLTESDLTLPAEEMTGVQTSSDLTLPHSAAPTSRELPPLPVSAPPPAPPPVAAPPARPSAPERDLSETIIAYQPGTIMETANVAQPTTVVTGGQTAPDLTPPAVAPAPPATAAPTSSDLRLPHSAAPTSRELPPPPVSAPPPALPKPPTPVQPAPSMASTMALSTPAQDAATRTLSQPLTPLRQPPPPVVKKKRSIVPWIIGILIVLFLGGAGLAAAGYIFRGQIREFLKPWLESKSSPTPTPTDGNANANRSTNANSNSANTNTSSNTNTEPKKEPEAFVPPADAVQFTNSKDSLDGDLAQHYAGFSFYYPKSWTLDPKAGVPGASNFAAVDHQFTDSTGTYLQERVLFNWYPSKGSYDADTAVFPESAKKVTDHLPNFAEVSRGEITINSYKGYEVRFKGEFKGGEKSIPYWGRLILLPPGDKAEKGGVAIVMLATSYSPGVTSAGDVGGKGELAMLLESFRLAPRP